MGFSTDEVVAGGSGSLPAGDGLVKVVAGVGDLADVGVDYLAPTSDHGLLGDLLADDHTQYARLAGRATGQSLVGGTASGDDLELASTAHATKGHTRIGGSGGLLWDESVARGAVGGAIDANWLWTVRQVNSSGLRIQGQSTDARAHQRLVDSADARNMDLFQYGSATAGDFITGVANSGLAGVYSEGGSGMILGTGNNTSTRIIANNLVRFHANGTGLAFFGATPAAQGAAVADASGGAIIDAEARTALNTLLARIRTTGLIAT